MGPGEDLTTTVRRRRAAPQVDDEPRRALVVAAAVKNLDRVDDAEDAELARRRADDVVPRDRRHGVERRARDLDAAVVEEHAADVLGERQRREARGGEHRAAAPETALARLVTY